MGRRPLRTEDVVALVVTARYPACFAGGCRGRADFAERAQANLGHVAEEGSLAARLADVAEHLDAWRAGDEHAGRIAADSLDQLLGLLPDLVATFERLRVVLPVVLADLPNFPE